MLKGDFKAAGKTTPTRYPDEGSKPRNSAGGNGNKTDHTIHRSLRRGARCKDQHDPQSTVRQLFSPSRIATRAPHHLTGPVVAGYCHRCARTAARVNVDVIGVGTSVYDYLKGAIGQPAVPMNGSEGTDARDKSEQLGFVNCRAEWWWKLREASTPITG